MEQWSLSLDAWIVQDGNYPDFESGQQAEFAVEFFFFESPELADDVAPSIRHIHGTCYEISGRIQATEERAWALDCGIGIYQDAPPPTGVEIGDFVRGTANLGG